MIDSKKDVKTNIYELGKELAQNEEHRLEEVAKRLDLNNKTLCYFRNLGKNKDKKWSQFNFDVMFGSGRSSLDDFLLMVYLCGGRIVYDDIEI